MCDGVGYRVAYCDFECPYCWNTQPLIKRRTQLSSRIRFSIGHFPLFEHGRRQTCDWRLVVVKTPLEVAWFEEHLSREDSLSCRKVRDDQLPAETWLRIDRRMMLQEGIPARLEAWG